MTAFAAIGLDHGHIHGQVEELRAAGGRLVGYPTHSDAAAEAFEARAWGDGRIVLTGTDGVLELRKYVDSAGPNGLELAPHLILTNGDVPRRIPCADRSGFSAAILADAHNGTDTAIAQETAFHIMELGLDAQEMAERSAA